MDSNYRNTTSNLLIVFKIKKENKYKTGIKIANTQYAKKIPYYQTKLAQYKILTTVLKVFCIICICISVLLISRPIKSRNIRD